MGNWDPGAGLNKVLVLDGLAKDQDCFGSFFVSWSLSPESRLTKAGAARFRLRGAGQTGSVKTYAIRTTSPLGSSPWT
jgi:hypothetical protein